MASISSPNYYEILQVAPDASPADIKRAYRALSLEWHPDRNSSPEAHSKIQVINEAYETLSDAQKRSFYDMELQMDAHGGGMPPSSSDMEDINHLLNMMFGSLSRATPHGFFPVHAAGPQIHVFTSSSASNGAPPHPFAFFGQGPPPPFFSPPNRMNPTNNVLEPLEPIVKHVTVTFQQAYTGMILPVEVEVTTHELDTDMKISQMKIIEVPIPAGVDDEELIVLPGAGHVRGAERGDIKIVVKCEPSAIYERQGMNLLYKKTITLKESLCGFSFEVMHPSGKQLMLNNLTNRTIIRPGYKKIISNLGMMREGNSGNLTVEFQVVFPDVLSVDQMDKLSAIL